MPKSPDDRLSVLVLNAADGGAETSLEVADDIGVDVKTASAYLCRLADDGAIERNGDFWHHSRWRPFKRYRPKPAPRADGRAA